MVNESCVIEFLLAENELKFNILAILKAKCDYPTDPYNETVCYFKFGSWVHNGFEL